jgi:membrane protein YqaA with SNARE-associated domain
MALANSERAPQALAGVSFAESSFFPIPPDVMLVPMAMARPDRAYYYAGICTIASVLGGLLGYAIGAFAFDTIGQWIITLYGGREKIEELRALYREWGALLILIKGVTPIPFKFVTIASGIAGYDIVMFILLSILTRGIRFYAVAGVMNVFGGPIKAFIERHMTLVATLFIVGLVGGFVAIKYLF